MTTAHSADPAQVRQRFLAEFGTFALRCGDRARLLDEAAVRTATALEADCSAVAVFRPETGDFIVEAGAGWSDEVIGRQIVPGDRSSMAGRVAVDLPVTEHAPVVVHDPDPSAPPPDGFALLRRHGMRSAIAAPLICGSELVGVIEAAARRLGAFEEDRHLIQGLASILGAALTRMAAEEDRDRLVREVEESERRYRFMAETIPHIVWTAGPDGRIDYYNRRWTDYTGLPVDVGTQGDWPQVIHPEDEESTLEAWAASIATGRPYEVEHRICRAEGGWRWMLSRSWPLRDEDGRVIRWFGTATDIDDEKQVQLAISAARDAAERANLAKSHFLAAASHDLRQPLNALGLLVGTLRARLRNPRNLDVLEQVEASLDAMGELFEGLLDLSKLESGAVPVDIRPVGIAPLFARLERDFGPEAGAKGLRLRMRASDIRVLTDATLLERVLRNLIGNAVRYTRRGGVVVGLRRRNDRVRIDVCDTGPGIAPEHLEEIFQEFRQLDNPARQRGGGHGIGLAIVRRVSDILGHPVTVASKPGRGSRFSIELPVTTAPEAPAVLAGGPKCRPRSIAPLSVLVLEDDPLVMIATRLLLENIGCTVMEARTVAEALLMVSRGDTPGLVLADYRLPGGLDGLEGVRRLRAACGRDIPATVITGDVTDALEPLARASGVDLLRKPVRPDDLQQLVERVRNR